MTRLSGGGYFTQIADIIRTRSVLPTTETEVGGCEWSVVGEVDIA